MILNAIPLNNCIMCFKLSSSNLFLIAIKFKLLPNSLLLFILFLFLTLLSLSLLFLNLLKLLLDKKLQESDAKKFSIGPVVYVLREQRQSYLFFFSIVY